MNLLIRLEIRHAHDAVAIRAAFDRPLPELDGRTVADLIGKGCELATLSRTREAAGTMVVGKVGMWRATNRYS